MTPRTGILLFAHGASDPEWAEPFRRIQKHLAELRPNTPTVLGFLERMTPSFAQGIVALTQAGCTEVVVAPLFLARGGHLKADLPTLLESARLAHPGLTVRTLGALGDYEPLLQTIARLVIEAAELQTPQGRD